MYNDDDGCEINQKPSHSVFLHRIAVNNFLYLLEFCLNIDIISMH